MTTYIIRRLWSAVLVLLAVSLISFFIVFLVPGDPAALIAGENASAEKLEEIRHTLGYDRPVQERIVTWYASLIKGDLGDSYLLNRSVVDAIVERIPVTISLTLLSFTMVLVLGLGTGILAAVHQNTWVDQLCVGFALLGVATPNFWLGILLIYLFSVHLGLLPAGGYVSFAADPVMWLRSLLMPAFSLALMQVGYLARIVRSELVEVLSQDYIRTAEAKGVPASRVVLVHALKNSMIPTITVIGIILSLLISGSVVIETVYSLPGFGRLLATSILSRDYPVIQGGLLISASIFVFVNLIVDLLYARFNPNIRFGKSSN